jgi:membrane protease YdiL (CAAX protease family)
MGGVNKCLQNLETCARRCGEIVCASPTVNTNRCWRLADCLFLLMVALAIRVTLLFFHLDTLLGKELGYAVLVLVVVGYGLRKKRMPLTEMGFGITCGAVWWTVAAIALAPLVYLGIIYFQHESYRMLLQSKLHALIQLGFRLSFESEEFKRTALLLALAATSEEMLFRAVLLGTLLRVFRIPAAVIVQACAFGILHYFFWGRDAVLCAAVLGVLLGYLVIRTGSLWPAIAGHVSTSIVVFYWLPVP